MRTWSLTTRYFFLALILLALIALGWWLRPLWRSLVIAALIAYLLYPVVRWVEKKLRLSHVVAVNLVYFLALLLILGLPSILIPFFFEELQKIAQDMITLFSRLRSQAMRVVVFAGIPLYPGRFIPDLTQVTNAFLQNLSTHALEWLESTTRGLAWVLVMLVAVYYLLHDATRLRHWLIHQAPPAYQSDLERLFREIKKVWDAYLEGQLKLMVIVAIIFTLAWLIIGLPGAVILGILTGLFSLIPEIGPLVASLLAVAVALIEGSTYLPLSNLWFAGLVIVIYLVLINLKNIWLRPFVIGHSMNMHHGVVFIAILTAAVLEGVLGALIAVPVLASVDVIWRYLRNRIYGEPPFSGFSSPVQVESAVTDATSPAAESSPSRRKR